MYIYYLFIYLDCVVLAYKVRTFAQTVGVKKRLTLVDYLKYLTDTTGKNQISTEQMEI